MENETTKKKEGKVFGEYSKYYTLVSQEEIGGSVYDVFTNDPYWRPCEDSLCSLPYRTIEGVKSHKVYSVETRVPVTLK